MCLCVFYSMNLYRFFKVIMVYYATPNCHKDSRFNNIKNGLYQDWRHHPVPSGNYANQLKVSWGAKFKFLLNVNLNNFIIEHKPETEIILLVPLDHTNIFQAHWANLKSPGMTFNRQVNRPIYRERRVGLSRWGRVIANSSKLPVVF
jgi:hypothetical protein